MRRVFGADAPTKDEAVWVVGRKVGGVGDDGVEALSDALVLTGVGSQNVRAHRGREPYLEYGIDEKGVGVGENEQGGVDAGGVFEALNTALHGGVLEASGKAKARGGALTKGIWRRALSMSGLRTPRSSWDSSRRHSAL